MRGKYKRTRAIKEKMSIAAKAFFSDHPHHSLGKKPSSDTRKKMSEAMYKRLADLKAEGKPHFLTGRVVSAEQRLKQSQAMRGKMAGPRHPKWKNGRKISMGYIYVKQIGHPGANSYGYVREHRLIMEKIIGRLLKPSEVVHHINGDKADNRPANLILFPNHRAHSDYHKAKKYCPHCGAVLN